MAIWKNPPKLVTDKGVEGRRDLRVNSSTKSGNRNTEEEELMHFAPPPPRVCPRPRNSPQIGRQVCAWKGHSFGAPAVIDYRSCASR